MATAKQPIVIAHRGAAGEAPENTLASFKLALEQNCDAIELDVHLSADDRVIVCHDDKIDRTTNGSGYIREMTLDQLKRYDAGSWFGEKYEGERLPLLEEVLDLIPSHIMINIEIKNTTMTYDGIEQKVYDILVNKHRVNQVVISSFNHQSLYEIKELDNNIKIGLLYSHKFVSDEEYVKLFGDRKVYSMHPSHKILNKHVITNLRDEKLEVYPYTINDETLATKLVESGVTGLITDFPGKMYKLVYQKDSINS